MIIRTAMGRTAPMITALLFLLVVHSAYGVFSAMRNAKCIIPNGKEHRVRAALLQQCLSKNYGQGNETKCYDELGCFPMSKPWTSLLRPLPAPLHPAEINVMLYCYTRESPERYNITLWPSIDLEGCHFDPCRKTAFVVHGFASTGNFSWMNELKDAYLKRLDSNVFLVDWGYGAQMLNYLQVASNTRIVGAEVGRFIKWLIETKGLNPTDVHLMGHSLGSHICSYAAKRNPGIGRLTAFDPAQPGFEGVNKKCRLDKRDADYVEVLHTNAAPFIPLLGFGLMSTYGDVDIYVNGGVRQPGCHLPNITRIKSIGDLKDFSVEFMSMLVACSHGRSYEFFTSTLKNNCTIWCKAAGLTRNILNGITLGYIDPLFSKLRRCTPKRCLPLGLDTPLYKARGVFAATTSKTYPYCETDPDVNDRLWREISEDTDDETTCSCSTSGEEDTVEESEDVSSGTSIMSGVADKGKEAYSGIKGYFCRG